MAKPLTPEELAHERAYLALCLTSNGMCDDYRDERRAELLATIDELRKRVAELERGRRAKEQGDG